MADLVCCDVKTEYTDMYESEVKVEDSSYMERYGNITEVNLDIKSEYLEPIEANTELNIKVEDDIEHCSNNMTDTINYNYNNSRLMPSCNEENINQSKKPTEKVTLLKKLILHQMKENDDVRDHLNELWDAVNRLEDMGVSVNPDLLSIIMLNSLSASFDNFRVFIESREVLPSPEDLKVKIEEYNARSKRRRKLDDSLPRKIFKRNEKLQTKSSEMEQGISKMDEANSSEHTPPELREGAEETKNYLLPPKSANVYEKYYQEFKTWQTGKNTVSFSEDVFLAYFHHMSQEYSPPSLWNRFSILKSTVALKHNINLTGYTSLAAFLKTNAEGYKPKKAKTFLPGEINKFIEEAPDHQFLMTKVAVIFGIVGACRRHELHDLKFESVQDFNSTLLVTIQQTKTRNERSFTVTGKYYDICKCYMNLRPQYCQTPSFFIKYVNGQCFRQNVGINKFGDMGKQVARFLKLKDPQVYTGHCFRRSSATMLVDAGGDITSRKRHGNWKSVVTEEYIDDSIPNEMNISNEPNVQEQAIDLAHTSGSRTTRNIMSNIYREDISENSQDDSSISPIENFQDNS